MATLAQQLGTLQTSAAAWVLHALHAWGIHNSTLLTCSPLCPHPPPLSLLCALPVCLRMQVDPTNSDFEGISAERAFADYTLACLVLFLAVWNYMG